MALDASKAVAIEGSNGYDFTEHTFLDVGDRRDVRAMNVNTMDEVPNSSWFTNRIGVRDMPLDEIVRGPNEMETIDFAGWPIVQEKSSGITPGFRIRDPRGPALPDQVRPAVESRDGERRRGHWRRDLSRARLQRGPGLRGRYRSGENGPLSGGHDGGHDRPAAAHAPERHRPPAGTRGAAARWQVPGDAEPVRRRPAARLLQVLRDASRRSERHSPARAPS